MSALRKSRREQLELTANKNGSFDKPETIKDGADCGLSVSAHLLECDDWCAVTEQTDMSSVHSRLCERNDSWSKSDGGRGLKVCY